MIDQNTTQTVISVTWPSVAIALIGFLTVIVNKIGEKVQIVKENQDQMAVKVEQTHILVNSGDKVKLEMIVAMARRLAESGAPADIDALHAAEKALADHNTKQAVMDGVAAGIAKITK